MCNGSGIMVLQCVKGAQANGVHARASRWCPISYRQSRGRREPTPVMRVCHVTTCSPAKAGAQGFYAGSFVTLGPGLRRGTE